MKHLWILCSLAVLPILAHPAVVSVVSTPQAESLATGQISQTLGILEASHELSVKYGSRPPYSGPRFAQKQALDEADTQNVIPYLIACESRDHSVKIVDSNGFYSYGILQMQSSTAALFNSLEGTHYDPMKPVEAVELAEIAIEHGYLYRWSCASIEKLI